LDCVLSLVDEGARIRALVASLAGGVVASATVDGPTNPRFVGPAGLRRNLQSCVEKTLGGIADVVCLAVTASVPADPETLRATLAELALIDRERVLVAPVEQCALAGSLGSAELSRGIVIHADVSSRGWGVAEPGREVSAGGFGEVMGDEGSAYWIGLRGLRAALRAAERRHRQTHLKTRALRHFGVDSPRDLLRPDHEPPAVDRYAIASFAADVFTAAREDDLAAVEIVEQAGRELSSLALSLVNELELLDHPFAVLPTGSVFRLKGLCLETFIKTLKNKTSKANLVQEGMGSAAGGLLLAIQHLGLKARPETAQVLRASLEPAR